MLEKENFQNLGLEIGYPFNVLYNCSPEFFPMHWHNYIEIILPLQEGIQYEINGRIYAPQPKDVLFIWSGELHASVYQPQPSHVLMLQFDYSVISNRSDFHDKLYLFHRLHIVKNSENPELAAALGAKLTTLKKIFFSSENFRDVKMCIELYQFFMLLGDHLLSAPFSAPSDIKPSNNRITEKMISVCSYLSSHCTENISLESAAEYAGFSKSHFSRIFKEFTANSYTDFITKERLHKAEELLTNSNLSITDAALQSGFNSISTFNRTFKRYKRCSPTEFRDLYQISHV